MDKEKLQEKINFSLKAKKGLRDILKSIKSMPELGASEIEKFQASNERCFINGIEQLSEKIVSMIIQAEKDIKKYKKEIEGMK